jgi:hypothetical protein
MVSALLLNWKRLENLIKVIESIRSQTIDVEILLWNNNPEDDTKYDVDVQINSSKNLMCYPRWFLMNYASGEYIFTLDDDLMFKDDSVLEDCVNFLKNKNVLIGRHGVLLNEYNDYWESNHVKASPISNEEVDIIKGRFMMGDKKNFNSAKLLISEFDNITHKNPKIEDDIYMSSQFNGCKIIPKFLHDRFIELPTLGVGCWETPPHKKMRIDYSKKYHNKKFNEATILILTYIDENTGRPKLPHIEHIYKYNPDVDVRIIADKDSSKGKEYHWKNGDMSLRKWWKKNGKSVTNDNVIIIEWDTLIDDKIPKMPDNFDLVGGKMIKENPSIRGNWNIKVMADPTWTDDNWYWWPDIKHMNLKDDQLAAGLISFGFFMTKKWVLDSICNPRWDSIYEKSIQNELRFPTVAQLEGAKVGEIDLPFVHFKYMEYKNIPGIYHPIKEKIF